MKGLKIGVDIDEVVLKTFEKYLPLFNQKFGYNLGLQDMTEDGIWDLTNISKEDSLKLFDEFSETTGFENLEFVEGAKKSLEELSKKNEISFITSRPERYKEKTKRFFYTHFPKNGYTFFFSKGVSENIRTKGEICKELGIDYFIEDNKEYALGCADKGIKTFLLDKPWNQNYQKHKNLVKVNNWNEILERLK